MHLPVNDDAHLCNINGNLEKALSPVRNMTGREKWTFTFGQC